MVELPLELPEPIEPEPVEPLPVLGELVLGDLVLEPELVELPLLMPDEAPVELLVPPEAPLELDLLKCASHSAREIWPSLFLSTSEKLGVEELPEEDELPPEAAGDEDEDEPDAPLDLSLVLLLSVVADGVEDDEDDGLLEDEDEDCATASVDRAKSTAAVVTLRVLRIWRSPSGGNCSATDAIAVPSGYDRPWLT